MEEVLALLAALDLPALSDMHQHPYLEVRVRLEAPEPDLRTRVEAVLENKSVRLARIETSVAHKASGVVEPMSLDDLNHLQPEDIFKRLEEYIGRFKKLLVLISGQQLELEFDRYCNYVGIFKGSEE